MAVEHLLAGQADLHGSIEYPRGLGDDHFMIEGIALPAKPSTVRRRDDPDVGRRKPERFGQRPVHVVRRLCGRPEHELAVRILRRQGRMLFDGQMRIALVEKRVLEHEVGLAKGRLDIAETERHDLVDVVLVAVRMNGPLRRLEAVFWRGDGRERRVLDVDEVERFKRRQLVTRYHRGDRVADESHAVDGERVLVLAHREDSVAGGEILAGQDQVNARMGEGARHVDADDVGVRNRRSQQLAVHHPRQREVVREARLPGDLGARVDPPSGFPDDVHSLSTGAVAPPRASPPTTAASTASKIC